MSDYYDGPVETVPQRSAPGPASPPPSKRRWPFALGVFAVVALVWLLIDGRNEIARWHYAGALEEWSAGNHDEAYERIDSALSWDSDEARYYRQRADWKREQGDYEAALADSELALKHGGETPEALVAHAQILQHLGRHAEAVALWERIEQASLVGDVDRATALNGLAYAQALGKIDLDKALERANQALQQQESSAAILDTRGYIHFLRGDLEAAKADLDRSVEAMEAMLKQGMASFEKDRADMPDDREGLKALTEFKYSTAVIRYHRALVNEALKLEDEAEADRARVRELIGRDGDEQLF